MKVLVVVDMQKDFVTGPLGTPEAQAIVPEIVDLIYDYNNNGDLVVFTFDTHNDDYLQTREGQKLPVPHCIRGTDGWALVKEIEDALDGDEVMVYKHTFGDIDLMEVIYDCFADGEEPTCITFVGVCTGICVLANVAIATAYQPDCPIEVRADLCACVTPESHERALAAMEMLQVDIRRATDPV